MRYRMAVLLSLAAASCAAPKTDVVPEGHRRLEREGITFYFRPEHAAVVETVLPAIQEARSNLHPVLAQMRAALDEARTRQRALSAAPLDAQVGERLLQEVAALLHPGAPEMELMRQIWTATASRLPQAMASGLELGLAILSLDRIRIVTAEEIVQGRVPYFSYRDEPPPGRLTMSVQFQFAFDERSGGTAEGAPQTSPARPAFPVFIGRLPNGDTWQRILEKSGSSSPGGPDASSLFGDTEPGFLEAIEAAYELGPLHEAAELALLRTLEIEEPLARWFHDGMANYLALEAIRVVLGQEAHDRCPYAPATLEEYVGARDRVNLLAWPRADLEDHRPVPEVSAHYFFATEEIRGLADRHGKAFIGRLLRELQEHKPVDTETICCVVEELTGDDLLARLAAYAPAPTAPLESLESSATAALADRKLGHAIRILQEFVALRPRETVPRYLLAIAYLGFDPEKHLSDFLSHSLIYRALSRSRGELPRNPVFLKGRETAPGLFAVGRLCEELSAPKEAREYYEQALQLDPGHAASRERLGALDFKKE